MTRPRKPVALHKKLLFSLLVFALFFYGIDRAAKAVVKHYRIPVDGRDVLPGTVVENSRHSFVDPDPARIWALRPGTKNSRRDIFINADGFRGDEPAAAAARGKTVVMIGDSCVFGWGVGHKETLAVRLSEHLADKGVPANVVNAGVPGYSSLQALHHLAIILEKHRPDIVTIQVGWNDSWPTPSLSDSEILAKGGGLISFNFFARKLWVVRLFSYLVSRRSYEKFQAAGSAGEPKFRVTTAEYRANLGEMLRLCREHGALPVLVTLPQRKPVEKPGIAPYLETLRETAAATATPVIDLVPPLQSAREENESLFVDTIHFSDEGGKLAAQLIAEALVESGTFATSP